MNTSRRDFLKTSGLAAAGAVAFPTVVTSSLRGKRAPSERIVIASLGVGSRGNGVLGGFMRNYDDVQAVAVCDPFRSRCVKTKAAVDEYYGNTDCKAYEDYREVLAREDVDACLVTASDHWHIHLAAAAVRAGKDVYVEKPLSISPGWSWRLREIVREHGAVFQYGTQQRSMKSFRRACELVRNGYLGEIQRVEVWCPDAADDWPYFTVERYGMTEEQPVPDELNYDLWTGPAPMRPYNEDRVRREGSFHVYDTGIGFMAGWGAHPLDIAQWGLDMDGSGPIRYQGTGKLPERGLLSGVEEWDVQCTYPNGVEMRFLSKRIAEPHVKTYRERWSGHGTTFFGTQGWLSVDRGGIEYGDEKLAEVELGSKDTPLYASPAHDRNFLDCVKSRKPTVSPLEAAIRGDMISHLAQLAVRTGRVIDWDPVTETAADPFVHSILDRPQRLPYQI
jgi:predicted dehydrogenase